MLRYTWLIGMVGTFLFINGAQGSGIQISEFMASNTRTLDDEGGHFEDWIELVNTSGTPVDLAGWFLSDDLSQSKKWSFPTDVPELTGLAPGEFLIVWADGDLFDPGLHTNFSLRAEGEEIGLFNPEGFLVDSIIYQAQDADVSYGRDRDGHWGVMEQATPGQANSAIFQGIVAPVRFSLERGLYDDPIEVSLSTDTEAAEIWYTLDAEEPIPSVVGNLYTAPIEVAGNLCIRAVAIKDGWKPSDSVTHTYIFPDQVLVQSNEPNGFPLTWGQCGAADYAMDPRVVFDSAYVHEMREALIAIPTVCVVVRNDDFFGAERGIYSNPKARGIEWERAASFEYLDPVTGDHMGVNAGIRAHGGVGSKCSTRKRAMRMLFKPEYGSNWLEYPLFPGTEVKAFDSLVLRSTWNYSWVMGNNNKRHRAMYMRDTWARHTLQAMGRLAPHSRHVHLYVNSLYWGLYILCERPDEGFAVQHMGGDDEDYDVLKAANGSAPMEIITGDRRAWDELFELVEGGLATETAWAAFQKQVNVPALIDYILMVYYGASQDAPVMGGNARNFYVMRNRKENGPFTFVAWDTELIMQNLGDDYYSKLGGAENPTLLFKHLLDNPEARMWVADHIQRHFAPGGLLTPEKAIKRFEAILPDIASPIICESARWGDVHRVDPPYTRDVEWEAERIRFLFDYFPQRSVIVLDQLRNRGFYPQFDAPVFKVNGQTQYGGTCNRGATLDISALDGLGQVYYTLDGTDPRLSAQFINASDGNDESWTRTLIPESAPKQVWVPTHDIGIDWRSAGFDATSWADGTPTVPGKTGGVGYDRNATYLPYVSYDVYDTMYNRNTSCYIRIPFSVSAEDLDGADTLILKMRCDDGYAVFLNGVEVASLNRPAELTWNAWCVQRDDSTAFIRQDLSVHVDRLLIGDNLLAIHAMNREPDSSDFLISPVLEIGHETSGDSGWLPAEVNPAAFVADRTLALERTTRIKARIHTGSEWSALSEAVFYVETEIDTLRITEIMYHPADPNTEFIEITNIGTESVNLNLLSFNVGIAYTFGDIDLAAGRSIVVVQNLVAFEARYGSDIPIAGTYQGRLANGGERVSLTDAQARILSEVRYDDDWHPSTDGGGYSLCLRNPAETMPTASDPNAWQASSSKGGSPGEM